MGLTDPYCLKELLDEYCVKLSAEVIFGTGLVRVIF